MGWVTEHALAVLALWLVWSVAETWLTAPRWAWLIAAAVLGVLAEWTLGGRWWLGVGIGGGAAVLMLLTDLVVVATDAAKVRVLGSTPPRR